MTLTTMVDPEEPHGGPGRRRLLVFAATVIAAVVLAVAGVSALTDEEPLTIDDDNQQLRAGGPFLAEDSFVLQNYDTLSAEERSCWSSLTFDQIVARGLPFLKNNRYYTRFFLKEAETVELTVESSVPLGAELAGAREGVSIMLIPGTAPYGQLHAHDYLPPTETGNGGYFKELSRSGNSWQVSWAIAALESDYYWLIFANTARQDAWCHYTISVPSD